MPIFKVKANYFSVHDPSISLSPWNMTPSWKPSFQNLHPPTISSWLQWASRYTLNVSMLETLSYGVLSFSIFASDAPASYWFSFTASSSFPLSSPLFLFPPLIFRLPQRGRVSCFLAHMSKDCVKELSSHWTTI